MRLNLLKKKENQKIIPWNVKKGAVAALAGMILMASASGGTVAHAVSVDTAGDNSIPSFDGTKPYCKLEMEANPDEGSGFALSTLAFSKGNATRTISAKFFYKSGEDKYYTTGSTHTAGTTKYVEMKTRVAGSVNVGAKSHYSIEYKGAKWPYNLKLGKPPADLSGWKQIG